MIDNTRCPRNRAPRVQIDYDVELYGAAKKIQLPFVMGVLAAWWITRTITKPINEADLIDKIKSFA